MNLPSQWISRQRHRPLLSLLLAFLMHSCSGTLQEEDREIAISKNPNGRNDSWGFVGYGGGGAMFYPKVSPHNPDLVLVACDMTGSFVTNDGGDSWRMFNLRGPVEYFVFDPLDSNTVYANSVALFKSTDRGNTWNLFYPPLSEIQGLVSKGDHATEVVATKDGTRRKVTAFAVDPDDSKKLYSAISIDNAHGFYSSEDGGVHWRKEIDLQDEPKNIFVDPSSSEASRVVFVTGKTSVTSRINGIWKTNKGPEKVKQLTEFSGGYDRNKNKYILYAISGRSYFNPEGDPSGVYYTEDAGATWENRQDGILQFLIEDAEIPEWRSIATSEGHPGVVYVSYNSLQVHADTTCIGVARSEDYGKTWTLAWKDFLIKNKNIPSANFRSGWINERFGPTWGENPFSLAVSPVDPDICYGTDFGRTVKTIDGGKTWDQVYTKRKQNGGWVSRGLEVTTSYSVVFDPFDSRHLFISNTDVGLMESKDAGESWSSATFNNGVPRLWVNSTYWLSFDPDVEGKAWAVMSGTHDLPRPKMFRRNGTTEYKGGILVTEDAGRSWTPISSEIGEAAMTHILVDLETKKERRTLYACAFGKGVYKSVDGGKTWKQKNQGIDGDEPFAWRISKRPGDGVLFLVVCRRSEDESIGSEGDGALYSSDDGAETWTKVSMPPNTNGPMSVEFDPAAPKGIILSAWGRRTEGKFSPDIGGGIFLSHDDGKSWDHVLSQDQHIHDVTFDSRTNRYYACGFNGSAYWSDDRGRNWERIKGYNFKWGKRVDFDPRDPARIFIITFGGGVWYGPASGDENAVEDILSLPK
ncbi:MAG: hypothetical protein WD824_01780 [Cyclobacteriaceae bacterium]